MRRAVALVLLAACGDNTPPPAPMIEVASLPTVVSRELDVLLQMDDSPSDLIVENVGRYFGELLTDLAIVDGQLPDLHIGVVTSDFGTTGSLDYGNPAPSIGSIGNGGCQGHGKDGALQLSGAPVSDAFVIDEDNGAGGRTANYSGELVNVMTTMLRVGGGGCGFEQPLAATKRAFDNPVNAGFRRADANLLMLFVADEYDCSIRDAAIVGPDSAELGPLTSFRCTRFGVICDQPMTELGTKTGCHAAVGSTYVDALAGYEDAFRAQAANPSKLVVAGIVGVPAPVVVEARSTGGGPTTPALAHSCSWQSATGGAAADPAVRLAQLIGDFHSHGTLTSGCTNNLTLQFREIARVTKQMFGIACIDTAALAQPLDCEALEVNHVTATQHAVPFTISADPAACPETAGHARVMVEPNAPSPDTHVEVTCRTAGPAR